MTGTKGETAKSRKKRAKKKTTKAAKPRRKATKRRISRARASRGSGRGTPNADRALEVDQIVLSIVVLMGNDEWHAGLSEIELARKHGVAVDTVRPWVAQAARFIRLSLDPDEMKALYVQEAEHVRRLALKRTTPRRKSYRRFSSKTGKMETYYKHVDMPDPDHRAVLKAIEVKSRLLGIYRQTIELEDKRNEFEGWTDEELERFNETGEVPARLKSNAASS